MNYLKKVMIALMPFAIAIGGAAASGLGTPKLNVQAQYRPNNNSEATCTTGLTEQENCSPASGQQCTIVGNSEDAFLVGSECKIPLNFNE